MHETLFDKYIKENKDLSKINIKVLENYKAKSDGTTLKEHIEDLLHIAEYIKHIFDLDEKTYKDLVVAIIVHDIGKISNLFKEQIKLAEKGDIKASIIRHEIMSVSLFLLNKYQKIWVLFHHKSREKLLKNRIKGGIKKIYLEELEYISKETNLLFEDTTAFIDDIVKEKDSFANFKDLSDRENFLGELYTILGKGMLQYCDHVASAGIREIDIGFDAKTSYKYDNYNSIQKKVFDLDNKEDILMIAPTGLGKTSTALFWSDLMQNDQKSRRIYYILPYISSINSMFIDMDKKDLSVAMLHSRLEYFLEKLVLDSSDDKGCRTKEDKEVVDFKVKGLLDVYKKGIKQINICTIYQIFKSAFSCKRFEMSLVQFKNSIFIIDEIHCFDTEQLATLLTILKFFKEKLNVSLCVMSASIPSILQQQITKVLDIKKVIKADKEDFKIRHKIHRVDETILDNLDKVKKDLNGGKRIIICVNNVDSSQLLYEKLKQYNPVLIHSKFNTRDREKIEQKLKTSNLLIGTQAIEVSLDIDYDVLYTELAPFESLLQRCGRVNRRALKEIANVYVFNSILEYNVYADIGVLDRTDLVLRKIIAEDKGFILEEKTQIYLDEIYKELDIKSYNKFAECVNHILTNLKIGEYQKSSDNISNKGALVLPRVLLDEYITYIKDSEYLKADSLFVNISNTQFGKAKSDGLIDEEHKIYSEDKAKSFNVQVIDCVYDERGLVLYERNGACIL